MNGDFLTSFPLQSILLPQAIGLLRDYKDNPEIKLVDCSNSINRVFVCLNTLMKAPTFRFARVYKVDPGRPNAYFIDHFDDLWAEL